MNNKLLILFSFLILNFSNAFSQKDFQNEDYEIIELEKQAEASFSIREYDQSVELRSKAIIKSKIEQEWESVVRNYSYIFVIAITTDDLLSAESALDSALLYSNKYLDEDNLAYYKLLGLQAYNEIENANFSRAINLLEEAVEGIERIDQDFKDLNSNVINLISVYRFKGDFEFAYNLAQQHLFLLEDYKLNYLSQYVNLLNLIGSILFDIGKPKEAVTFLSSAIKSIENIENEWDKSFYLSENYQYLTEIYFSQQKNETAFDLINKAILASNQPIIKQTPTTLELNVKILIELKKLNDALYFSRLNLNNYQQKEIRIDKTEAIYSSTLGHVLHLQNELDSAQYYLNLASDLVDLPIEKNLKTHEEYLTVPNFNTNTILILSRIAALDLTLYENSGDVTYRDNALKRYQQAFNGAKFLQKELSSKAAKTQLNRTIQKHFSSYLDILLDIYQESQDEQTYTAIVQLIEDNKSIVLKQDVYEKNLKLKANLPQELLDHELAIQEKMNSLNRKIKKHKVQEGEEHLVDEWKSELLDLKYQEKDIQKQIETDYPTYYNSKYTLQNVDLQALRNELEEGEMYLNYYRSDSLMICAWMTKNNQGIKIIDDLEKVDAAVDQLNQISRTDPATGFSVKAFDSFCKVSFDLYQTLLPTDNRVFDQTQNLIISPTHQLNYFPFEILVKSINIGFTSFKNLDYLIKSHNIEYASSAELWLSSQDSEKDELNSIVSLAPFIGEGKATNRSALGDEDLANLPCSDDEVESIAHYYKHTPIKGLDANKSVFKELGKHDIIHLATHAIVDETSPELNRLMFHDDYLDIQDLENMQLDAKLAVLSACNTGSGALRSGEGVINLGKGFRSAGVPSFVTSLWSINDCATASIIDGFYGQLENENISNALRLAKLDYLSNADKLTAHPYYWSGLVFSGNKNVFSTNQALPYWAYLLIGLFGLVCISILLRRNKKSK